MSRRARWAPRLMPEARRDAISAALAEAEHHKTLERQALHSPRPDLAPTFAGYAVGHQDYASALCSAELYWITTPMARVAKGPAGAPLKTTDERVMVWRR